MHEIAACPHREKTCENCGKAPGLLRAETTGAGFGVSDPGWSGACYWRNFWANLGKVLCKFI